MLALDLGTSLGWALGQGHKIINSGIYDLAAEAKYHKGSSSRGFKKAMFQEFLTSFLMVQDFVHEDMRGLDSYFDTFFLYNLIGDMEMFTECAGKGEPQKIHAMTVKKEFTGSGRATKEDMCEQAHSMGWRGGKRGTKVDNDEADAIALLTVYQRRKGIEMRF